MSIKEYTENLIRPMLSKPEALVIDETIDKMGVLLTVSANNADIPFLVGKSGATIQAVRNIVRVVGMRNNERVSVKILTDNN